MANGTWKDQTIVFREQGTEEKPITLRAETSEKVVLTGRSSLSIDGEDTTVSGVLLENGQLSDDGVRLVGKRCRLTQSVVVGGAYKFFVHVFGTGGHGFKQEPFF